jgi:hypothetical protein
MSANNTLLIFPAMAGEPPAEQWARPANWNDRPCLAFTDQTGQDETTYFHAIMPRHYTAGPILAKLHWSAPGTGFVVWGAKVERLQAGTDDLDDDGFAAESTATSEITTQDCPVIESIAIDNLDGIEAGDLFRLAIRRLSSDGSDTLAGDAYLLAIELFEDEV